MKDIYIRETDCFGEISEDSISFDDMDYFGTSLILFDISKIICYVKFNEGIIGMKLIYRDRENKENKNEIQTINIRTNEKNYIEQEFSFEFDEKIDNIILWKDDYIKGFEISTNKKRNKRFGFDNGQIIRLNEFASLQNIIIGFYLRFDYKKGVTAIGFYYIEKKLYLPILYSGLFYLRAKLGNKSYMDSIIKIISKNDGKNYAILKTCLLPKNIFFGIMKYLIV